jgi:DNA-directed RNA polymerase subunit beta
VKKDLFKKLKKLSLKKNKIYELKQSTELINSQILNTPIKRFFNSSAISQLLEETNSVTEITHKRKVGFLLSNNSNKKNGNFEIREIHPSHYCKICPVETAEGKSAGLVWSLTKEARVNKKGFIETPFYL